MKREKRIQVQAD
uniref:Uncharacterized protein n=1 Tax=Rhizophora mucronata TaxID=61149 RepID=A0A2P2LG30_RHIMU